MKRLILKKFNFAVEQVKHNMMKNKKVQVSLLLDEEVVEWVKNEAAQNEDDSVN